MIEYNPENQEQVPRPGRSSICVVGVGGAGANVLDRIALENMVDAELVSMNTDVRALTNAVSSKKLQLGAEITRGLGAGGDPDLGRESAEKEVEGIREALQGKEMVFICTGLGGGTGSGAAPYIARVAREMGAFVVAFATMPFSFEGKRRVNQAEASLAELEDCANALITFENDRMGQLALNKSGIQEAFTTADRVISQSVRAVTMLVTQPGIIRIGMDDLMTALRNTESRCLFGYGSAKGKNRAHEALKEAMKSPLLDRGKMLDRASSVLVHIAGGDSMTLYEVELLMKSLGKHVNEDAHILFGVANDEKLGDNLTVTIITSIAQEEGLDPDGTDAPAERVSETAPPPAARALAEPALIEVEPALATAEVEEAPQAELPRSPQPEPSEAPKKSQQPESLTQAPTQEEAPEVEMEEEESSPVSSEEPEEGVEAVIDEEPEAPVELPEVEEKKEIGINLLPQIFDRKPDLETDDAEEPASLAVQEDEVDVDLEAVGEESEEKVSVIASFIDRSKISLGIAAVADEASLPTEEERVEKEVEEPVSEAPAPEPAFASTTTPSAGALARAKAKAKAARAKAAQPSLELDQGKSGRFAKGEPTIKDGEDLDVPTFMRRKG